MKDEKYRKAKEEATLYNLLETCACCFDDELIPEECYFCQKGCIFCKDCVKNGTEAAIGKGDVAFPCFTECGSEFNISTLKMVLDKNVFEALFKKIQANEVIKAKIEGLETCPFCDFAVIPDENDKIFRCENEECMKITCRGCRHESHIPLKCNEIEFDEDVKMRTYIENKMTEALLRQCPSCARKFYKESGCNKMTCYCGMKMCYVCGLANINYNHFSNSGCTLYTNNLVEFHNQRIIQGAQLAKQELGINENPNKLKFDPAKDIIVGG